MEEACQRCESKNLVCTAKTWGPRRTEAAVSPSPTGESVQANNADSADSLVLAVDSSAEPSSIGKAVSEGCFIPATINEVDALTWEHLSYLRDLDRQLLSTEVMMPRRSILFVREVSWTREKRSKPIQMAFPWPEFTMVSKSFRYAALALACRNRDRAATPNMLTYMSKYFHYVQQAIDENSLVEVAAATYAVLLNEYVANQGVHEVTRHFQGLCAVLKELETQEIAPCDARLLKDVFRGALRALRLASWAMHEPDYGISVEQINELISLTATLQQMPPNPFASVQCDSFPELDSEYIERMNGLECYLLIYLDTYLALRNFLSANGHMLHKSCIESIERSILDIIETLTLLIPQRRGAAQLLTWASGGCRNTLEPVQEPLVDEWVDKFDYHDVKAALLFAWAKVIQSIICGASAETIHYTAISAARVLYRLSSVGLRKAPYQGLDISKCLFWSGLILTKDVDIDGIALH